ncbi:hypothetical protein ENUP19_0164G0012 [Entamoeba nuttalli]|uniref:Etoposide-induced protein 2.4 n=2 Tax=Entamoeba nuttalli TaxID=412467 RepID=K2HNJ5_ENTNP|nr:hypothetical protein ENU1_197490 [Entamoeba nuttalli P19]EKE37440.1 hypothetical protein ENU1_197490 [Entamoeba nuttalli P19]|eukprot:XP_008860225.1 hypothetical protein ENU1_197490 [Entamoeba nuttalli P19]
MSVKIKGQFPNELEEDYLGKKEIPKTTKKLSDYSTLIDNSLTEDNNIPKEEKEQDINNTILHKVNQINETDNTSEISEEILTNQKNMENQLQTVSSFKLFINGVKSYKWIRVVFTRILKNKDLFIHPYSRIVLINVIVLGGFYTISNYLIFPLLLHQFGNEQKELEGAVSTVWNIFYTITYNSLLLYALYKSESYYKIIAEQYNHIKHNSNAQIGAGPYSLYFTLLTMTMLASSLLIRLIPFLRIFELFMIDILYAFYAFNLKLQLRYQNMNLEKVVYCIDSRLFFFVGFGSLFTLSCFFVDQIISNTLYSLLFPFVCFYLCCVLLNYVKQLT